MDTERRPAGGNETTRYWRTGRERVFLSLRWRGRTAERETGDTATLIREILHILRLVLRSSDGASGSTLFPLSLSLSPSLICIFFSIPFSLLSKFFYSLYSVFFFFRSNSFIFFQSSNTHSHLFLFLFLSSLLFPKFFPYFLHLFSHYLSIFFNPFFYLFFYCFNSFFIFLFSVIFSKFPLFPSFTV